MSSFWSNARKIGYGSIPIILFFILWEIGAGQVPKGVISPPSEVLQSLWAAAASEILFKQTAISLGRVGMGFALSIVVALPLGFILGTFFQSAEKVLLPFFRMCEKLNPFAIIPIFMIFFGIGTAEKVAIVFWATLWPLLFNTVAGARAVEYPLIRAARSMGATRRELFLKVILPFSLPNIFIGVEIAAQLSFFMIIASEVIGASTGLGWYYISATTKYQLPLMYGIVLYITVLSILINLLFGRLKKRFLLWKEAVHIH
ncbi:ABC transporter permease [Paenibacillus apii]|uniref:ABC transporter permease n=1 Tax=Paenibacillus apii TaxID=1850370 RepID=UPI00143A1EEF|nr:ABC transporter permease [Paenibacillus apii]NJJ40760.1 ABC transporter permease [Paenibacillus apii]